MYAELRHSPTCDCSMCERVDDLVAHTRSLDAAVREAEGVILEWMKVDGRCYCSRGQSSDGFCVACRFESWLSRHGKDKGER